jgi:hypothetical protein
MCSSEKNDTGNDTAEIVSAVSLTPLKFGKKIL